MSKLSIQSSYRANDQIKEDAHHRVNIWRRALPLTFCEVLQSEGATAGAHSREQKLRWGPRLAIVQPALGVQSPILTLRRQARKVNADHSMQSFVVIGMAAVHVLTVAPCVPHNLTPHKSL